MRLAFYIRKFEPFPDVGNAVVSRREWKRVKEEERDDGPVRETVARRDFEGAVFCRFAIFSKSLQHDTGSGLHSLNSKFERSYYVAVKNRQLLQSQMLQRHLNTMA